ncbi:MAG: F0F1 ATP synthase subunit epsilon [Castellaniella sp.]
MNTETNLMTVRLFVPDQCLHEGRACRVAAVAEDGGAFTLLPQHADFVAALQASVLVVEDKRGKEHFFGIDYGLLVKQGFEVRIAVRRAVRGESLATLGDTVARQFSDLDETERAARSALSRLEVGIVRQFGALRSPPP